jgi:hypothetical protein
MPPKAGRRPRRAGQAVGSDSPASAAEFPTPPPRCSSSSSGVHGPSSLRYLPLPPLPSGTSAARSQNRRDRGNALVASTLMPRHKPWHRRYPRAALITRWPPDIVSALHTSPPPPCPMPCRDVPWRSVRWILRALRTPFTPERSSHLRQQWCERGSAARRCEPEPEHRR